MPPTYPRQLKSLFKESRTQPKKIDAAVQWYDSKTYLFAGQEYYRLNERKPFQVAYSYPRSTANWWFGCDNLKHHQK